jgi:glycosyltransferase involved in cell wall biosynthesis
VRVLGIAANDVLGGAARSAYRLHQGLSRAGVEARMLVRWKHSEDSSVTGLDASWQDEEHVASERAIRQRWVRENRTDRTDTLFSLGMPSIDIAAHPLVRWASVLHLHWCANFQGPASFGSLTALGTPVVWTLHDEWGYTGGCHYTAGCERYRDACDACPQLREDPLRLVGQGFDARRAAWIDAPLTVVAPSRWLADRARASAILGDHDVHLIPYGLDTGLFRPASRPARSAFRAAHGIADDAVVLAFGVDRIGERRKGYAHLLRALEGLSGATLLRFGDASGIGHGDELALPSVDLGPIQNDADLALAYAAADAFVLPTLEDNLPNGVLEAMACGTAVIAYATGGIPDVIDDGIEGLLVPTGDVERLARTLRVAVAAPADLGRMGQAGRERAERDHTLCRQAERYASLYRECVARHEERVA